METETEEEIYLLEKPWVLWFHNVNDSNWEQDSYEKLCEVQSIKDFWELFNTISNINAGMFFLMKEDIFPRWEDINNIDGGFWSFRIMKKDICSKMINSHFSIEFLIFEWFS